MKRLFYERIYSAESGQGLVCHFHRRSMLDAAFFNHVLCMGESFVSYEGAVSGW